LLDEDKLTAFCFIEKKELCHHRYQTMLLDKLESIKKRFEEVERELGTPESFSES
jgi:hypothetical protein